MNWNPENWDAWIEPGTGNARHVPGHLAVVRGILQRIPGHWNKSVALLGDPVADHGFLDDRFGRIVNLAPHRGGACSPAQENFDVAVAEDWFDPSNARGFSRSLAWTRNLLREGGVLVASFPADPRTRGPFPFRLGRGEAGQGLPYIHEIELQYRLQDAGFQGARIRRFPAGDDSDRLVSIAVRRALN